MSDDVRTVLVVGHEPTMSQAAVLLAGPESDPTTLARVRVGVPTASWSLLEVDGWAALATRRRRACAGSRSPSDLSTST